MSYEQGRANVGKSTLLNAVMDDETSFAQALRQYVHYLVGH